MIEKECVAVLAAVLPSLLNESRARKGINRSIDGRGLKEEERRGHSDQRKRKGED
jgi:hypothetical protein